MMLRLLLVATLLLPACGYHLAGQGQTTVFPDGVSSASLSTDAHAKKNELLMELQQLWQSKERFPLLTENGKGKEHVTLRIEKVAITFTPIAYNAAGLAVQHRLQVSASLHMYQEAEQVWQSGRINVTADIFGGGDPSVTEAERERLTEQLQRQWAKEAVARIQSGF